MYVKQIWIYFAAKLLKVCNVRVCLILLNCRVCIIFRDSDVSLQCMRHKKPNMWDCWWCVFCFSGGARQQTCFHVRINRTKSVLTQLFIPGQSLSLNVMGCFWKINSLGTIRYLVTRCCSKSRGVKSSVRTTIYCLYICSTFVVALAVKV